LPTPSPITRSSHAPSAASSWTCTSGQVLSPPSFPASSFPLTCLSCHRDETQL
jgi:hypothetical protein